MEIKGEDVVMVTNLNGTTELYTVAKVAPRGGLTLRPLRWTDAPAADLNGERWRLTTVDCLHAGDVISTDEDAMHAAKLEDAEERASYMDWIAVGRDSLLVVGLSVYPSGLDRCEIRVARRSWDDSTEMDETTCNGGDEVLVWRPEE